MPMFCMFKKIKYLYLNVKPPQKSMYFTYWNKWVINNFGPAASLKIHTCACNQSELNFGLSLFLSTSRFIKYKCASGTQSEYRWPIRIDLHFVYIFLYLSFYNMNSHPDPNHITGFPLELIFRLIPLVPKNNQRGCIKWPHFACLFELILYLIATGAY